ncbi:MAG: hypothetical protein VYB08_02425 [Candidatus Latescibacterota bacterium]|nr:hypothetical protein [Candidatus Latescibacterota bacterium]
MSRRSGIAAALLIGSGVLASADESTWTALPARAQLQQDQVLIPKGKGLLFVPAMTLGNEPSYQIWRDGRIVSSASPGIGIPLDPGTYELFFGSGAIAQRFSKTVPIFDGERTLLKPDWSGLVIDVLDNTRTAVNESYEILDATTGETYGLGFGIEEERGERVRTWLLKPGVYHIVRVGESFTTIRKFSAQLQPGTLTQRNLIFDSGSGDFIGFYPRLVEQTQAFRSATSVVSQTELSGAAQLNTSQNTGGDDRASLNFTVQVFNRTRYSTDRDFASIRVILEEGATKEEGEDLRKSTDRAEVRATYIRRLSPRFGPYLRGVVQTTLFSDDARFASPQDVVRTLKSGAVDTLQSREELTLAPALSPLTFREGVGINSQLIRSFALNMDLRLGVGAQQTLVTDNFKLGEVDDQRTMTELESTSSTGLETLLIMDARLSRYVNLDSEFDLLMTSRDRADWFFTWENRLRIALTSFINLDLVADLERNQTLDDTQGREQVLLRFSRFF